MGDHVVPLANDVSEYAGYEGLSPWPSAHQDIATLLIGPPLMGCAMHAMLFGVVASNFVVYLYSDWYKRDSGRLRALVYTVVVLDALATAVSFVQAYYHFTYQRRDVFALVLSWWLDAVPPVLSGLCELLVQLFLAQRASRLFVHQARVQKVFLRTINVLCVMAFICSISATAFFALYMQAGEKDPAGTGTRAIFLSNVSSSAWLWLSAFVDVVLSLSLFFILRKQMASLLGPNKRRTEGAIRKVIGLGLQTAAYTSIVAVAGAASAIAWSPDDIMHINVFIAFAYPLPSLYAFSMLVTLNQRRAIADQKEYEASPTDTVFAPPARKKAGAVRRPEKRSSFLHRGHSAHTKTTDYSAAQVSFVVEVEVEEEEAEVEDNLRPSCSRSESVHPSLRSASHEGGASIRHARSAEDCVPPRAQDVAPAEW